MLRINNKYLWGKQWAFVIVECERGHKDFVASNGWRIRSREKPDISHYNKTLYTLGLGMGGDDNIMVVSFGILSKIEDAIKEFNDQNTNALPQPGEYWEDREGNIHKLEAQDDETYSLESNLNSWTPEGKEYPGENESSGDLIRRMEVTPYGKA